MYLIDARIFAENLKHYREQKTLTVKDLARSIDTISSVITTLESGIQRPTDQQLSQLARCLSVREEQLILPRPPEIDPFESC